MINIIKNNYIVIFILALTAFGLKLKSQEVRHIKGDQSEASFSSCFDSEGNVLLTGYLQEHTIFEDFKLTIAGDSDYFLLQSDTTGNINWLCTGGGNKKENMMISEYGKKIMTGSNGDIIVSGIFNGRGHFSDSAVLDSYGGDDIFIASFKNSGQLKWIKHFGGKGHDAVMDMKITLQDQILITGLLTSPYKMNNRENKEIMSYAFLALLNNKGDLCWLRKHSGPKGVRARSVSSDKNGNIYWALGFTGSMNKLNLDTFGNSDCYIEKINPEGELIWGTSFGGENNDAIRSIECNEFGNIFVLGEFSEKLCIGSHQLVSNGGNDIFLALFDKDGSLMQLNNYGGKGYDEPDDMIVTRDNKTIISGIFMDFKLNDNTSISAIDRDAFVMVVDAFGDIIGFQQYWGYGTERINSLSIHNEEVLLSGYFNKELVIDSAVFKSQGKEDIFYSVVDVNDLLFSNENEEGQYYKYDTRISIIPNPTNAIVTVDCADIDRFSKLSIVDFEGKIIWTNVNVGCPFTYDFSDKSNGTYIVTVEIDNNTYHRKIIVN